MDDGLLVVLGCAVVVGVIVYVIQRGADGTRRSGRDGASGDGFDGGDGGGGD